jgi:hypothetical protein
MGAFFSAPSTVTEERGVNLLKTCDLDSSALKEAKQFICFLKITCSIFASVS